MFIMNSCHLLVLQVQNKKEVAPNHGTTSYISLFFACLGLFVFLCAHILSVVHVQQGHFFMIG